MIALQSVSIKEFRGIRDLTLDFKGKNFAICGPNGTGKSGVVDALEFVLTGCVSRLSGEGRGEVSLKAHGPHVDKRNDPIKAKVTAIVEIPSLKKTVTIERNLKTPSDLKVTPNDPDVVSILQSVEKHPEIVLSRRELIRYVLATPGKRAEEVQALLHLDQIEKVRAVLQKIANGLERQLPPLEVSFNQARTNLMKATGIDELTKEKIVVAANVQRAILGLPELSPIDKLTSLKDGLVVADQKEPQPQRVPKAQALTDIKFLKAVLNDLMASDIGKSLESVLKEIKVLAEDTSLLSTIKRDSFYAIGLEFSTDNACPLCDKTWDLAELKAHIKAKLDHSKAVAAKRKAIEAQLAPFVNILRKVCNSIAAVLAHAVTAKPPISTANLHAYLAETKIKVDEIVAFLPIAKTIATLGALQSVPQPVMDELAAFEKIVNALPEPSKQDAAREWLTLAQERLEVMRDASQKLSAAKAEATKAKKVSEIYSQTNDAVLTGVYSAVEKDFESLYAIVHHDDEELFKAKITPSLGKLGFDVDFYGRGYFPPGAYHSEGHQDSMGLCLYLALMRHLQGRSFTFAVLDDVLMSVDIAHRRQVCTLLKKHFPNTQFVITTHDPIWLKHMRTEQLLSGRGSVFFRTWDVDSGPYQWDGRDVWQEIDEYLSKNMVREAAGLLRHYLEYIAGELCHRLRARVEYRGDAQYQLGELMPASIACMKKLLATAKAAANSWNQRDIILNISTREESFGKLVSASNVEQWPINAAIHFNSWENLQKEDFLPVVKAFSELIMGFKCSACGEFFFVAPDRESPQCLRCECGGINLNLLPRR